MDKKTIQLILIIIVATRAIVRLFKIDFPGYLWLNIAAGVAFLILLVWWIIDWYQKRKQDNQ